MTEGNPRGMKLDSESMMLLMALADGELEGDDRVRAESLVSSSEDARTFLNELQGLGGAVRVAAEPAPVARYDVADDVMAKLGILSGAPTADRAPVIPLKKPSPRKSAGGRVGLVVAGAFALAASVAIMNRPKSLDVADGTVAPLRGGPGGSASSGQSVVATTGVEVDRVESDTHQVSVFYVPSGNDSPSVVIWIDDSTSGSGGD